MRTEAPVDVALIVLCSASTTMNELLISAWRAYRGCSSTHRASRYVSKARIPHKHLEGTARREQQHRPLRPLRPLRRRRRPQWRCSSLGFRDQRLCAPAQRPCRSNYYPRVRRSQIGARASYSRVPLSLVQLVAQLTIPAHWLGGLECRHLGLARQDETCPTNDDLPARPACTIRAIPSEE